MSTVATLEKDDLDLIIEDYPLMGKTVRQVRAIGRTLVTNVRASCMVPAEIRSPAIYCCGAVRACQAREASRAAALGL